MKKTIAKILLVTLFVTSLIQAFPSSAQMNRCLGQEAEFETATPSDADKEPNGGDISMATSSEADIGTETATPSEAAAPFFIYGIPAEEDIPSWYSQVSCDDREVIYFTFLDRFGNRCWRTFGGWDEDSLYWYPCSETGQVLPSAEVLDLLEEDVVLAPYRYHSETPSADDFAFLYSKNNWPDLECGVIDPYLGLNYDGTNYDVWWFSEDLDNYQAETYYYFYGYQENGMPLPDWYACDDFGKILDIKTHNPAERAYTMGTADVMIYLASGSRHIEMQPGGTLYFTYNVTNGVDNFSYRENGGGWNKTSKLAVKPDGDSRSIICGSYSYGSGPVKVELMATYPVNDDWDYESIIGTYYINYGHTYGDWVTAVPPSCTLAGTQTRTCSICNFSESRTIPAAGHSWGASYTRIAATCLSTGITAHQCGVCSTVQDIGAVPKLNHISPGSYTQNGGYKDKYCTRNCGTRLEHLPITYTVRYCSENQVYKNQVCTYDQSYPILGFNIITDSPAYGMEYCHWDDSTINPIAAYTPGQFIKNLTTVDNGVINLYPAQTGKYMDVSFYPNGGTGESVSCRERVGNLISVPRYSRTGYKFQGFYTLNGKSYNGSVWYEDNEKLDLYASWKPNSYYVYLSGSPENALGHGAPGIPFYIRKEYNIAYGDDGHGNPKPIGELKPGICQAGQDYFTFPGLKFTGFYKDVNENNDNRIDFSTQPMADKAVTFWGSWEAIEYTVTFDYGLTEDDNVTRERHYYDPIGELPGYDLADRKPGYHLEGWYSQPDGQGEKISKDSRCPAEDITYHAFWVPNTYTVTFNYPSGTGPESMEATFDKAFGKLPMGELEDFTFYGWYREKAEASDCCIYAGEKAPDSGLVIAQTIYKDTIPVTLYSYYKLAYLDNGNHTNTRPGSDLQFGTEDDNYYYNGSDHRAGTRDDVKINPGADGFYGTEDDFYQDEAGYPVYPGNDKVFDTQDDYKDLENGTNQRPGKDGLFNEGDDDLIVNNGLDGIPGTEDDFIDNQDGTNLRPGKDGIFNNENDELWDNGPDGIPGTDDDRRIQHSSGSGDLSGNGGSSESGSGDFSGSGGSSGSGSGGFSGNGGSSGSGSGSGSDGSSGTGGLSGTGNSSDSDDSYFTWKTSSVKIPKKSPYVKTDIAPSDTLHTPEIGEFLAAYGQAMDNVDSLSPAIGGKRVSGAQTGDNTDIQFYLFLFGISLLGLILLYKKRPLKENYIRSVRRGIKR